MPLDLDALVLPRPAQFHATGLSDVSIIREALDHQADQECDALSTSCGQDIRTDIYKAAKRFVTCHEMWLAADRAVRESDEDPE